MEAQLTDLNALCLEVRDPLSRSYVDEAIKAYRAGSLKAAIVATWVAVTFDIIAKIRELADGGDAQARAFIDTHDANVGSSNAKKLLEIEAGLLDEAETKFEFIDPISRRHFDRLKQDRNLCAHPAFTIDGPLFAPEPELVRLYIVEAVRNLLALRPVVGKTILDLFDRDFQSDLFPTTEEDVTRFVRIRHLANARPSVHASLGIVLVKAFLRELPPGWDRHYTLIPAALQAIRDTDPKVWGDRLLKQTVALIEDAPIDVLANAFFLLTRFDDLRQSLTEIAITRLRSLIQNYAPNNRDVRPFYAIKIPEFADLVVDKFIAADREVKSLVVVFFPDRRLWPTACDMLGRAISYRNAEYLFSAFITPFRSVLTPGDVTRLLATIISNNQIYQAAGIPTVLASFVETVGQRHPMVKGDAEAFASSLEGKGFFAEYAGVLRLFGIEAAPEDAD